MSVPPAMEFVQRDWQTRQDNRPMAGPAIIEAHKQARFDRLARRIAGASSYARIPLEDDARTALDALAPDDQTAAALYDKLVTERSQTTNRDMNHLRLFDRFLAKQPLSFPEVIQDFAAFATPFQAYKAALEGAKNSRHLIYAVARLQDLCFPELPFWKRIDALMEKEGSAFQALPATGKSQYRTIAGNFDTWLASKGYAPDTVPDDVEGLRTFLEIKQEACAQNKGDTSLQACLSLWREECHPLHLDDRLDAAIGTYPGAEPTKVKWRRIVRRLAEYAWCHPMPAAGDVHWVSTLDPNKEEWAKVCELPGVSESDLRPMVHHVRQALRAGAA